jgi:hypothetical protein
MAEAARQIDTFQTHEVTEIHEPPKIYVVPEMEGDEFARRRADRFLDSLGHTAVDTVVQLEEVKSPDEPEIESLKDAIHLAGEGDVRARRLVTANVATDVGERTMKVKYVTEVDLEVDEDGGIHQHGQPMKKVQGNSWLYAAKKWQMRERVRAENNNHFRLESSYRSGELEDSSFVEFSRAADNMDDKSMQREGFFTDTMSCAIRVTTIKDGVLTTQVAFVAGIIKLGEKRHDERTIVKVGQALGVNFIDKTATDVIDTPLLIHNSLLPNGVIDLVMIWDQCAGDTFFGEDNPEEPKSLEDYLEAVQESKKREASLEYKIETIVDELISSAWQINTPTDATKLLNKVSGKHMVEQAIFIDRSINPRVFGSEAATLIVSARHHADLGNIELAQAATTRAIKVEKSGSCPGVSSESEEEVDAFGNIIGDANDPVSKEWHGGKIIKNSKCRSCEKVKAEVGACHICKDCVGKPTELKKNYKRHQARERSKPKQSRGNRLGRGVLKLAA